MIKIIYTVLITVCSLILSSCVMGPVNTFETGRTLGKRKIELLGGLGSTGILGKFNYGLSENLDVGVQLETFSLGVRAKYALMNNQENGFSLSLATGAGVGGGNSQHYYGDVIASYLSGDFEPYMSYRFVHAINKSYKDRNDTSSNPIYTIQQPEFDYQQYNVGLRYWFNDLVNLSLELTKLQADRSQVIFKDKILINTAIGFKF